MKSDLERAKGYIEILTLEKQNLKVFQNLTLIYKVKILLIKIRICSEMWWKIKEIKPAISHQIIIIVEKSTKRIRKL